MVRKGVNRDEATKRVDKANWAFPDARVTKYSGLIEGLTLPDPDDRHVLAAAIKCNANVIVTNNLKDFPADYLQSFGIDVKSADDFLTDIIDLNQKRAIKAFKELVLNRKSPAMDEYAVLDRLRRIGLPDTANYIHALI